MHCGGIRRCRPQTNESYGVHDSNAHVYDEGCEGEIGMGTLMLWKISV